MRFRGSVAIDLGTVNTLVWVAGRGIVLEEPTAIAIDTGVGKVAAVGEAADALADKEPQDIQVIHPLRDGVIADLDATAAMLHAFLRRTRRFSLMRRDALVCVPSGATPVERRSIIAALGVRRPRYNVRLIDEPVAAAAGAGFDLSGGSGGFVVDIGGGTTEVAAVAGWRVVRSGYPAAARCCPAWPAGSRARRASGRSWSRTRCGAWSAARRRSWNARTPSSSLTSPDCVPYRGPLLHWLPADRARLPAGHQ